MLNLNKCTKTKPKPKPTLILRTARMCVRIIVYNRRTQYNTIN